MTLTELGLSPAFEEVHRADNLIHTSAVVFDDVPLRTADALAGLEDLRPLVRVSGFAKKRRGMSGLHMDGNSASGVPGHICNLIRASRTHVAEIALHDDVFVGAREEYVPYRRAIDQAELSGMAVEACPHVERFQFGVDCIEDVRGAFDAGAAAGVIAWKTWCDQPRVADRPVEFDRSVEFVTLERVQRGVAADRLESVVVEHLADVFGGDIVESGELNAFVAELRNGSQRSGHVSTEVPADGIQLERDRYFLSTVVLR